MREVQLYISGERVELFGDESISLTQTIQNVKDIGKVFANFSQSFNVPASQTNNKIFKHYYNYDINNGFDARKKTSASIELNHLPFQTGTIKLDGVQLKDNKPYAYKVTFYGDIVDLKDTFGDDKLGSLNWLSGFQVNYTSAQISSHLQSGPFNLTNSIDSVSYTGAWCMPLISNTTRLFYQSGVTPPDYFDADGKINPVGANLLPSANNNGVYYEELSYAIRVWLIVKAIEESYGITFSSDSFIKQTSNPQFYNLYMWMLREKGYPFKDISRQTILYSGNTVDVSSMTNVIMRADYLYIYGLIGSQVVNYEMTVTSSGAYDYIVYIKKDGVIYAQKGGVAGADVTMTGLLTNSSVGYQVYIESTPDPSVNYTVQWQLERTDISESNDYGVGSNASISTTIIFNAQDHIPNMKVIDFLTGLFKMFNLTAYKNTDGEIVVKPLDDYYAAGTERDISKYVYVNESEVNTALPFKDITFQYQGRGSKLAQLYEQTQGVGWGTLEYKQDNEIFGDTYFVESPFEHMQFEKFPSVTVQTGSSVDDSEKSYYGAPVLFYPYRILGGDLISFMTGPSSSTNISSYTIPLNSVDIDAATNDDSLHFGAEINEYDPTQVFNGSLFANYYQDYIVDIFNNKRRIVLLKCKLPISFLTTYSLADILIINGSKYRINSITTNLNTGEADLELLNEV